MPPPRCERRPEDILRHARRLLTDTRPQPSLYRDLGHPTSYVDRQTLTPSMTTRSGDAMSPSSNGSGLVISRRDVFRYSGLVGAAAMLSSTLAACGGPSSTNTSGHSKDSITAVVGYGNNQTWDPLQTASAFAMAAILHTYESLVEGDPITRAPYAGLAKALPADVSGTSLTFELREGAKWHDGQPVTADDVVFTYDRALDPKENVLIRSFFALWLEQVVKVSDTTVRFELQFPFPYALALNQPCKIVPKHVFAG